MALLLACLLVWGCSADDSVEQPDDIPIVLEAIGTAVAASLEVYDYEQPCLVARSQKVSAGSLARSWCDDEPIEWLAVADTLDGSGFVAIQYRADSEVLAMTSQDGERVDFMASIGPEWAVALAEPATPLDGFEIEIALPDIGESVIIQLAEVGQPGVGR